MQIFIQLKKKIKHKWIRFWMRHSGLSGLGRISTKFAAWFAPSFKSRVYLAKLNPQGYIAPSASILHPGLRLGGHVYIGERVVIWRARDGGRVELGENVKLYSDIIVETGAGGRLTVGAETHIQPRCQLMSYVGHLQIGCRVEVAPNCAFYPYNHGFEPGECIRNQPCWTKGGIIVGDDAWLGVGVVVLDGVRIGKGAVIGAGAVVTKDVPDGAIAFGVPAQVVKMRSDLAQKDEKVA